MTLTIDLTSEQEAALRYKAGLAGVDLSVYAGRVLAEVSLAEQHDSEEAPSLLESLTALGVVGVVDGAPGPGDGRY